jgi:hypothetical protein
MLAEHNNARNVLINYGRKMFIEQPTNSGKVSTFK